MWMKVEAKFTGLSSSSQCDASILGPSQLHRNTTEKSTAQIYHIIHQMHRNINCTEKSTTQKNHEKSTVHCRDQATAEISEVFGSECGHWKCNSKGTCRIAFKKLQEHRWWKFEGGNILLKALKGQSIVPYACDYCSLYPCVCHFVPLCTTLLHHIVPLCTMCAPLCTMCTIMYRHCDSWGGGCVPG